ncbi:MAG: MauE/DoxX family redox-associated membrane protein [Candidatus Zixiibacteriota bacterium]
MRKLIDNDLLTMLSRLLIGGMFLVASWYKILEPSDFARSIWYYHLVPGYLINLMSVIIPWLEVVIGVALILGLGYRGAALWSNLLLIVFVIALSTTIVRGISIDCGCFKAAEQANHSAWKAILFDLAALIPAVHLLASRSRRWTFAES